MNTDLRRSDFVVDPDIRRAESLPPSAFTDPRIAELEREWVLNRSWCYVPQPPDGARLSTVLRPPGSHMPFTLLDMPLMLKRDSWGTLRCLSNVCTHAWNILVDEPGQSKAIVCGAHGRRFACDGRLEWHDGFGYMPDFPRPCDHLREYPLAQWGDLMFIAPGRPHYTFDETFRSVRDSLKEFPYAECLRRKEQDEVRVVDGNWKQHVVNYLDQFHIRTVHPSLSRAVHMDTYRTEIYPRSILQWVYAKDPSHGFIPERLHERFGSQIHPGKRVFALWWYVYPNLAFNLYPWGYSLNMWTPVRGEPTKTRFYWYRFSRDEKLYARHNEDGLFKVVDAEDTRLLESVARGVNSPNAVRGRFAPEREIAVHWFHRTLSMALQSMM